MAETTSEKLLQLFKLLSREPADTFLLYGIGMEYKKLGDLEKAVEYFSRAIQSDAGYCYAYYQRAQVQERAGQADQARQSYLDGIEAAKRTGDAHAREELEAALSMM